ncbi:hypothetical protein Tco_1563835 [Tanacetum coccineum]
MRLNKRAYWLSRKAKSLNRHSQIRKKIGLEIWLLAPGELNSFKRDKKEAKVPQDEAEHEESVPTPSNDPQPSGEDSMQLTDLMVLCTKLQTQVLDLQKAKDAQAKEIAALKKRIQRLERRKMSRPTSLKRLRKVGMSRRVEFTEDQESLGAPEDASKQGRSIEDIDADVDVTLVDETQERQDDDLMFDTGVLEDDEMPVEAKVDGKDEQSTKPDDSTAGEAVTTASVEGSVVPTTIEEITLAQTLIQIKAAKPKVVTTAATTTTTTRPKDRGVVVQEPSEFRVPQEIQPSSSKDKGKAMMEDDRLLAERLQSKEREELTDGEKAKLFMELMEKKENILLHSEHNKRETDLLPRHKRELKCLLILSTWERQRKEGKKVVSETAKGRQKKDAWTEKSRERTTSKILKNQNVKKENESGIQLN